jgi:lysozyme
MNQAVLDIVAHIKRHEGLRLKPYKCTDGKVTIGYGRNLTSNGITDEEAAILLEHDVLNSIFELLAYDWFNQLDIVRKGVLIELHYNIGLPSVLGFLRMIAALEKKDYQSASEELLDSKWAKDVGPSRSKNMALRLLNGHY